MLNERENGKMAVTRILSGVDDITINGSNKNRASKKEEMELVSGSEVARQVAPQGHEGFVCSLLCCLLFRSTTTTRRGTALLRVINYAP